MRHSASSTIGNRMTVSRTIARPIPSNDSAYQAPICGIQETVSARSESAEPKKTTRPNARVIRATAIASCLPAFPRTTKASRAPISGKTPRIVSMGTLSILCSSPQANRPRINTTLTRTVPTTIQRP